MKNGHEFRCNSKFGSHTLHQFLYFFVFHFLFIHYFYFPSPKNTIKYFPFSFLWEKLLSHCVCLSVSTFPFFQISTDLIRRRFLQRFCILQRNQTSRLQEDWEYYSNRTFSLRKKFIKRKIFLPSFFTYNKCLGLRVYGVG